MLKANPPIIAPQVFPAYKLVAMGVHISLQDYALIPAKQCIYITLVNEMMRFRGNSI